MLISEDKKEVRQRNCSERKRSDQFEGGGKERVAGDMKVLKKRTEQFEGYPGKVLGGGDSVSCSGTLLMLDDKVVDIVLASDKLHSCCVT